MTASTSQLLSVFALLIECEELAASGDLSNKRETSLRKCIAQVLAQFKMPSMHERSLPDEFADDNYDRLLAKTARDLIVNNVIHLTPREVKR